MQRKVVDDVDPIELKYQTVQPVIADATTAAFLMIALFVAVGVALVGIMGWLPKFKRELKHLNLRIEQSISERERRYYVRRRRRLWLSIIPFVKYKK